MASQLKKDKTMNKVPLDKQLHLLAGAAVSSTVALYSEPLFGLIACAVVAVGKEIYDATGRGTPDVWDVVATVVGGLTVVPLILPT